MTTVMRTQLETPRKQKEQTKNKEESMGTTPNLFTTYLAFSLQLYFTQDFTGEWYMDLLQMGGC